IAGIAAPLFNREGEVLGSIALATSTRSTELERFRSLAPDVIEAARSISAGIASTANTVDLPARAPG
ncbi:MAG: IclR family transcriptional regulator, partial [Rhizobacter sp.]|nr:IclR family transcriptional regulator [Rhizobacter sp.]